MSSATRHPLADAYMNRLQSAARRLPRSQRAELLGEIETHLSESIDEHSSDADVLGVLERLGEPEEIVAAELPELAPPDSRGTPEWAAIFLLLLGGFVFGVGWIAGLILLWSSRAWTIRDKLIGTFIIPGGLAAGLILGAAVGVSSSGSSLLRRCTFGPNGGESHCFAVSSGMHAPGTSAITIVILVLALLSPIATSIYLALRAR